MSVRDVRSFEQAQGRATADGAQSLEWVLADELDRDARSVCASEGRLHVFGTAGEDGDGRVPAGLLGDSARCACRWPSSLRIAGW